MRTYLAVKYDDRHKAKSLGCRWDANVKCWYIENPDDLKPYAQWMPQNVEAFLRGSIDKPKQSHRPKKFKAKKLVKTGPKLFVPLCHCNVEPWEDCEHTEELAHKAFLEMSTI